MYIEEEKLKAWCVLTEQDNDNSNKLGAKQKVDS